MIRGIEFYIVVWGLVAISIIQFRNLTGKEKWKAAKIVAHSAIYAAIALALVVGMVVVF